MDQPPLDLVVKVFQRLCLARSTLLEGLQATQGPGFVPTLAASKLASLPAPAPTSAVLACLLACLS